MLRNLIFAIAIILSSCNSKYETREPEDVETMNSGKLDIFIDEEYATLMQQPLDNYKVDYPKVLLTSQVSNSRLCYAKLLSGSNRVIIVGRDYLNDEDSLMKEFAVNKHQFLDIAQDALVLAVTNDFPKDTINLYDFENYLLGTSDKLYSDIDIKPKVILPKTNSSVYANFIKYLVKENKLKQGIVKFTEMTSNELPIEKNSISIKLLSQIQGNTNIKPLKISYIDSAGLYVKPKPVHQAWMVLGKYPLTVQLKAIMLEDRRDLAFWFSSYLSKEKKVQEYLKDKGIVPSFARFKLITE